MKVYHFHRGATPSLLEKGFVDGKDLWYTSHKDFGWYLVEQDVARRNFKGNYTIYEIDIPNDKFTTSLEPNQTKILKITRENYKKFTKLYDVDPYGYDKEKLEQDFAGVDANDMTLARTHAFHAINGGPPSGVVWNFSGVRVKRKQVFQEESSHK